MRSRRMIATIAEPILAFAVCAALVVGASWSPVVAREEQAAARELAAIALDNLQTPEAAADSDEVRAAVSTFVWALSNGAENALWTFAPEEEQESFGTAEAAYEAVSNAFPPLLYATEISFERIATEGEMSTADLYIRDRLGLQWRAEIDLVRDDAGDWKIIGLAVEPDAGESI